MYVFTFHCVMHVMIQSALTKSCNQLCNLKTPIPIRHIKTSTTKQTNQPFKSCKHRVSHPQKNSLAGEKQEPSLPNRFLPAGRLPAACSPCTSPTRTTAQSAVDRPWCPRVRGKRTKKSVRRKSQTRLDSLLASSGRLQAAERAPDSTERSPRSSPRSFIAGSSLAPPVGHFKNVPLCGEIIKSSLRKLWGNVSQRNFRLFSAKL